MRLWLKTAVLGASLMMACMSAEARYVYDPADLPDHNAPCAVDDDAERCAEKRTEDAYWHRYGESFEKWFFALAYDPDPFFNPGYATDEEKDATDQAPVALLDIHHAIALRRYNGWTMALDMLCTTPQGGQSWRAQCRPVARLAQSRYFDPENTVQQADRAAIMAIFDQRGLPTSKAELAEDMELSMEWLEADVRTCKGAMAHIARFPGQTERLWEPEYLDWMSGRKLPVDPPMDDEIIITTDGDGYRVRAGGRTKPAGMEMAGASTYQTTVEWNGGTTYDWAAQFYKILSPCMKPATVPAPWQAYRLWATASEK